MSYSLRCGRSPTEPRRRPKVSRAQRPSVPAAAGSGDPRRTRPKSMPAAHAVWAAKSCTRQPRFLADSCSNPAALRLPRAGGSHDWPPWAPPIPPFLRAGVFPWLNHSLRRHRAGGGVGRLHNSIGRRRSLNQFRLGRTHYPAGVGFLAYLPPGQVRDKAAPAPALSRSPAGHTMRFLDVPTQADAQQEFRSNGHSRFYQRFAIEGHAPGCGCGFGPRGEGLPLADRPPDGRAGAGDRQQLSGPAGSQRGPGGLGLRCGLDLPADGDRGAASRPARRGHQRSGHRGRPAMSGRGQRRG